MAKEGAWLWVFYNSPPQVVLQNKCERKQMFLPMIWKHCGSLEEMNGENWVCVGIWVWGQLGYEETFFPHGEVFLQIHHEHIAKCGDIKKKLFISVIRTHSCYGNRLSFAQLENSFKNSFKQEEIKLNFPWCEFYANLY